MTLEFVRNSLFGPQGVLNCFQRSFFHLFELLDFLFLHVQLAADYVDRFTLKFMFALLNLLFNFYLPFGEPQLQILLHYLSRALFPSQFQKLGRLNYCLGLQSLLFSTLIGFLNLFLKLKTSNEARGLSFLTFYNNLLLFFLHFKVTGVFKFLTATFYLTTHVFIRVDCAFHPEQKFDT